ncbi:MAG: cadherin-like domain-containing protein, partial [Planctomycetota bacterium]
MARRRRYRRFASSRSWRSEPSARLGRSLQAERLELRRLLAVTPTEDLYIVHEDVSLDVPAATGVLANDVDSNGNELTAVLDSGPLSGNVALNSDGSFLYTPGANFSGVDFFTYRASDGFLQTDAVVVTVNITAVNDAPSVAAPLAPLETVEHQDLEIQGAGFSVGDVDGERHGGVGVIVVDPEEVEAVSTLIVSEGLITVDVGDSGATVDRGDGTAEVVVSGTVAQLDNLLTGVGSGTIVYRNDNDAPAASTTFTVSVSDQGNHGLDPGISGDGDSEVG